MLYGVLKLFCFVGLKRRERIAAHLTAVSPAGSVGASASQRCPPDTRTAMTKRSVILNAKRERIRIPLERETDCHSRLRGFAMTGKQKYTAHPMYLQITKRLVILNAKRERIRNPLEREADCRTPYGGLACRLGRCFCFAEVSAGHPHRNDKTVCHSERLRERIRNSLRGETDCHSRYTASQ